MGESGVSQNKIIDIWSERQNRQTNSDPKEHVNQDLPDHKVNETPNAHPDLNQMPPVDIEKMKLDLSSKERRLVKRTILQEFVGAFAVVPKIGLLPIQIHDISEGGVSFDVPAQHGRFQSSEIVPIRVYLGHASYFSFSVVVNNARSLENERCHRHGAYIQSAENEEALYHFIRFVESVSQSLHKDTGDRVRLRK
jgi:hypothetical protein